MRCVRGSSYPRLQVAEVTVADPFDDLLALVARDGARLVEVGVRLLPLENIDSVKTSRIIFRY